MSDFKFQKNIKQKYFQIIFLTIENVKQKDPIKLVANKSNSSILKNKVNIV